MSEQVNVGNNVPHYFHTMTAEHAAFVQGGQGSAGVVFIPHDVPIGRAIADLILICGASTAADWGVRTDFLPL